MDLAPRVRRGLKVPSHPLGSARGWTARRRPLGRRGASALSAAGHPPSLKALDPAAARWIGSADPGRRARTRRWAASSTSSSGCRTTPSAPTSSAGGARDRQGRAGPGAAPAGGARRAAGAAGRRRLPRGGGAGRPVRRRGRPRAPPRQADGGTLVIEEITAVPPAGAGGAAPRAQGRPRAAAWASPRTSPGGCR